MHKYQEVYEILEGSIPKKMPGLATTRLLARLEAINVILDEWDALKRHFELSASKERCHTAKGLSNAYNDPQNKPYLLFVRKVLKKVVRVNKIFQGQNADITKITEDLMDMYRSLMQVVVDAKYLSKCFQENLPNLNNKNYILPHKVVNSGHEFNCYAQISYVKEYCRSFMLELGNQVQQRLPDNVETLLMLQSLQPSNVISQSKSSIVPIACRYKSIFVDMDELENEWSNVNFVQWPQECLRDTVSYWAEVNEAPIL